MISHTEQPHPTVKLFIRADPEFGCEHRKQTVLQRLETLDAAGDIERYEVDIWTKEICVAGALEGTSYYRKIFDHIEAFRAWASEESVSLNAAFEDQSVECEITDESYTVVSLPCLCLAVYDDGDLCGVFPHTDDETTRTISGCLDLLERGGLLRYAD